MKKNYIVFGIVFIATLFFACNKKIDGFKPENVITVISREDGSGTRGAFIELAGIQEKGVGTSKDLTTAEAVIANSTNVVMTNVANDDYAIGYISVGSLNNTVKALSVDSIMPSPENVKNKSYAISRSFTVAISAIPEKVSPVVSDFINFILSDEGQKIINSRGYIGINDVSKPYSGALQDGKIVIAGSSSVSPVMEKLKEAYVIIQPNVIIELQTSDSTAGMTSVMQGLCDIGMASRTLKDSEKAQLHDIAICLDGIALIVNNNNPLETISKDSIKSIYTGSLQKWNEVK